MGFGAFSTSYLREEKKKKEQQTSFMACISSLTKATIAAIKLAIAHTGTDSHEQQEAGDSSATWHC